MDHRNRLTFSVIFLIPVLLLPLHGSIQPSAAQDREGAAAHKNWAVSPIQGDHASPALVGGLRWIIDQIGKDEAEVEILGSHTYSIASDLTIPTNIRLKAQKGAILAQTGGLHLTIKGPLDAGAWKVFEDDSSGNDWVVFGPGSVEAALPEWWGGRGDGASNATEAIQCAINSLGAGVVKLLNGTYIVRPVGERMLTIKSKIKIRGQGEGVSVLKVGDGVGPYSAILAGSTVTPNVSGFLLSDLTVDSNIENNPIDSPEEIRNFPRMPVQIYAGSEIDIERVTFQNESSINSVSINGKSVSKVNISGCRFLKIGENPKHIAHDHSSIYLHGDDVHITDNEFDGAAWTAPGAVTAIETHGSGYVITGNRVRKYRYGINITGVDGNGDSTLNIVSHNLFEVRNAGVMIWSQLYGAHTSGYGIDGLRISGNIVKVKQKSYPSAGNSAGGIKIEARSTLPLKGLHIHDNTIEFEPQDGEKVLADTFGIGFGPMDRSVGIEDTSIVNNSVRFAPNAAIRLSGTAKNLDIRGNTIIDAGSGSTTWRQEDRKVPLLMPMKSISGYLMIKGNTIIDSFDKTQIESAIHLSATEDSSRGAITLTDNECHLTGSDTSAFVTMHTIDTAHIKPMIDGDKTPRFKAPSAICRAGSRIYDRSTGRWHSLHAEGTLWNVVLYDTRPPISGSFAPGDRVVNSVPAPGEPKAWICTTGGTPGVWVSEGNL